MKIGLFDLEANGLLRQATKVHCGAVKEYKSGVIKKFRPYQIKELLEELESYDVLIAHNGIGYDFPLLKKLYNWEFKGKKVDTLLMSRLLNPKRLVPYDCPERGIGPHSIAAWGYRVGRGKPEHNDWENFSEDMMHRCSEDTEILELVYEELLKESKGGKWRNAFLLTFELFEHLQKQEEYGWLVDRQHMESCVKQLTRWIGLIDRAVVPRLPKILEIEETKKDGEYNYIRKPFLKSGNYSQSVIDWCSRVGLGSSDKPVLGCFSRINFRPTDLNSSYETKDYLLSLGWEPLEWNTDDKGNRTSPKLSKDDPFEGIEDKLGHIVARRVQCRQRRGIIEGLFGLIREDGRIASVVNTLAVTGRATHRNIVNIPKAGSFYGKQMRSIFTSKPGFVLVGTDSAGNQLRQLAARMGSPVYTKALIEGRKEDGTDNHSLTRDIGELESRDVAKNVIYCVPMDTQALTRDGWKHYSDLVIGEQVLTYNQKSQMKEWKPILALHEKYDEVIEMKHGHGFSIRSTRDHRWFVKQRRFMPTSSSYGKVNGRYMDYQIRTTDELNKESNIITNAPMSQDYGITAFEWNTSKYATNWTKRVCQASSAERKGFLAGFLIADGYWIEQGNWQFAQLDGPLFEAALTASFIESSGYIYTSSRVMENGKTMHASKISKKPHVTMMKMVKEVHPVQKVWCLSTDNESFVIRQGNTITITGNCLLFGGGDVKLAKTAKKPVGSGADLRSKLYRGLDGLGALVERITKEWRETARQRFNPKFNKMEYYDGYITGLDGRPIRVTSEHQLLVYLLQSDEALHMSKAYCLTFTELSKRFTWGVDFGIVGWVHDEIQIECREEIAEEVGEVCRWAIKAAGEHFNITCPHAGESEIGKNWYETH